MKAEHFWSWEAFWGGLLGGTAVVVLIVVGLVGTTLIRNSGMSDGDAAETGHYVVMGERLSANETINYRCPDGTLLMAIQDQGGRNSSLLPDALCLPYSEAEKK